MPYLPTVSRTVKQRFPHFNSVFLLPYNEALLPPTSSPGQLHTFSLVERWSWSYSVQHRTVVILMKSEALFWQLSHNLRRRHTVIKIPASGCEVMADNRPGLAGKTWSNDCAPLFARAWRKRRTVLVTAACYEGGVCDNTTCFTGRNSLILMLEQRFSKSRLILSPR